MKRFVIAIATRLLAAFIALSFLATLLPAGAVAAQSLMACCRGKAVAHCHSGFKPTRTTSVGNTCHSDCCSCCAPAQQIKRERTAVQPVVKLASPVVVASPFVNVVPLVLGSDEWAPISSRGPPALLVEQIS